MSGLSVAMPGPFDYENGISYITGLDKYEALYGMDIRQYLVDLLKIDPQLVVFRNDAESTIAGEVLSGAGKDYINVMGVTLGTGFGSAYSKMKVTKDINLGSLQYKETIADDYLSTRWFLKRYHELTGIKLTGGVKELAQIAVKNQIARDIFKEFAVNMSEFLSEPVEQFGPEALIICGNIAKASGFFLPHLTQKLNSIEIKFGQLDENAPLLGAAAMFDHIRRPGLL
jgi:glucokinase